MGKTFLKAAQQSVKRLKNKQTYNPKIPVVDTDLKGIAVNVTKIYTAALFIRVKECNKLSVQQ